MKRFQLQSINKGLFCREAWLSNLYVKATWSLGYDRNAVQLTQFGFTANIFNSAMYDLCGTQWLGAGRIRELETPDGPTIGETAIFQAGPGPRFPGQILPAPCALLLKLKAAGDPPYVTRKFFSPVPLALIEKGIGGVCYHEGKVMTNLLATGLLFWRQGITLSAAVGFESGQIVHIVPQLWHAKIGQWRDVESVEVADYVAVCRTRRRRRDGTSDPLTIERFHQLGWNWHKRNEWPSDL